MELARTGRVRLDEPVSVFFDEWRGADREPVTVRRSAGARLGAGGAAHRRAANEPP